MGQKIEARVLDRLSEGRWSVRFLGHNLVADSHLPLFPGQLVQTVVQSLGPRLCFLSSGSEASSIRRALQDLNLPSDPLNEAVVRALIRSGISVERAAILSLRDALAQLEGLPLEDPAALEELLQRALFLRSRDIPLTPGNLNAYLGQVPQGAFVTLLKGLVQLLGRFLKPGEFDGAAEKIRNLSILPGEMTPDSIRKAFEGLGLDLEGRIAGWMSGGAEGLPENIESTLRASLLLLLARLETSRGSSEIRASVRQILQMMDSMQMANLPTSPASGGFALQLPVLDDGRWTTAQLHIDPQGSNQTVDANDVRLILTLDLNGLGPLRIELSVTMGIADCVLTVEDQLKTEFLRGASDDLTEALIRCGYKVAGVSCRVSRSLDGEDLPSSYSAGLDLRV